MTVMNYLSFRCTRIGAAHIRLAIPCQDASATTDTCDLHIAVVADGHGSRRHFRSARGAQIACDVALEVITAVFNSGWMQFAAMDDCLQSVKQSICDRWIEEVEEDYRQNPWTDQELEEAERILSPEAFARLEDSSQATVPYGTTLCAAFLGAWGWAGIQIGDGCFVRVDYNGEYTWTMPESVMNQGNRTASLCMRDPMRDFRHCWGEELPAGLLVFSDGIEKTFQPQGKEILDFLHWVWNNARENLPCADTNLERTLDLLTQRSRIGDDVSIAGLVNPEAEDIVPRASLAQQHMEMERRNARVEELKSTISYNRQRLQYLERTKGDQQAVEKLRSILRRCIEELKRLLPDEEIPNELPLLFHPELDSFELEGQRENAQPFLGDAHFPKPVPEQAVNPQKEREQSGSQEDASAYAQQVDEDSPQYSGVLD